LAKGKHLANEGRLSEARYECEAALREDLCNTEAHILLAIVALEQGDVQTALDSCRRALYLAPDSALALFLSGVLLTQGGDRERGRQSMTGVVSLLSKAPAGQVVPGTDDVTVHHLLQAARSYLDGVGR
jgi:Flp pilus assembly protein TadD